jgi:23S rRNA (uridine2552-2'-O)-methyltransferase
MAPVRQDRRSSGRGDKPKGVPRGRTDSSTRWLKRQFADPYVHEARRIGYRSRAAFKLIGLDDRFRFLKAGRRVLDLGAAPGGWTQVAVERGHSATGKPSVIAIDLAPMDPIPGAVILELDVREPDALEKVRAALEGPVDVVLSDMAAPATGHAATDSIKIHALAELALEVAEQVLAPEGVFVTKVLQGGATGELLARLKRSFRQVRHAKPPASRTDSRELYLVATGYRGMPEGDSKAQ